MKPQPQLASMLKNQSFDGFLLVRAATQSAPPPTAASTWT